MNDDGTDSRSHETMTTIAQGSIDDALKLAEGAFKLDNIAREKHISIKLKVTEGLGSKYSDKKPYLSKRRTGTDVTNASREYGGGKPESALRIDAMTPPILINKQTNMTPPMLKNSIKQSLVTILPDSNEIEPSFEKTDERLAVPVVKVNGVGVGMARPFKRKR